MSPSTRLILAGAAGAALVGALWLSGGRPQRPAPARLGPLSHSGHDRSPSASPDGRMIAFASDRDRRSRVWLKELSSDEEIPLTDGPDDLPRFSPDGASILFVRTSPSGVALERLSVTGGERRRVVDNAAEGDWSPGGDRVAFVRGVPGEHPTWRLGVAPADGSGAILLADPDPLPLHSPRWSPDGRTIAAVRARATPRSGSDDVLLYDAATLRPRVRTLQSGSSIAALAWSGDGRLLVAQAASPTTYISAARVVRLDPSSGDSEDILYSPSLLGGLDVLGANRLVLEGHPMRQNLREVWFRESGAPAHWLSRGDSLDRQPVYSPDGEWVAFSSSRSGNLDIWTVATKTGAVRHLIDHPAEDFDPGFTPDGRLLLWSSNRSGPFEIWAAQADGRGARQVTQDGFDAENPTATASGWVIYNSTNPAKSGVWRIRLDGGAARCLVAGTTLRPEASPDGEHALYDVPGAGERMDIHVVRIADGGVESFTVAIDPGAVHVPPGLVLGRARWTPDGRAILFVGLDARGHLGILEQDFDPRRDTSSTRRPVAGFERESFAESFGISPDGSRLAVALLEEQSGLLLADGLSGISRPRPAVPR